MSKPLLRGLCTRSVEFRATSPDEGGDGRTLEGYAAVFNQPTEINSWEGHFNETIAPGAFKKGPSGTRSKPTEVNALKYSEAKNSSPKTLKSAWSIDTP